MKLVFEVSGIRNLPNSKTSQTTSEKNLTELQNKGLNCERAKRNVGMGK